MPGITEIARDAKGLYYVVENQRLYVNWKKGNVLYDVVNGNEVDLEKAREFLETIGVEQRME